ncbi:MAG: DNA replication and repair protein RecF [Chlorobium limicola]|nr:DNA replication and repair protein RecF [Chlorobium limicola]
MKIEQIQLVQFRNHKNLSYGPAEGINLLYGPNGSGKTSVLEGIHYCALTKGFVTAYDSECLAFGESFFLINGRFISDALKEDGVKVVYSRDNGKKLTVNGQDLTSFSQHIGSIPCITFSPAEMSVINGSPVERRRFLDNAICQADCRYLQSMLNYRRVLLQRNALLLQLKERFQSIEMLNVLTEQLSEYAADIVFARLRFLDEILPGLKAILSSVSVKEEPRITYRSSLVPSVYALTKEELINYFREQYAKKKQDEIARGLTAGGPHRDDIVFFLNQHEIKKYASQGQQRSFLIAMKMALYGYFSDKLNEKPVCLFDDLFSELDRSRVEVLFALLASFGQVFITATEKMHGPAVTTINIPEAI